MKWVMRTKNQIHEREYNDIYDHNHEWQVKSASMTDADFTDWLHCICQIKAQKAKLPPYLPFPFPPTSSYFVPLASVFFNSSSISFSPSCPLHSLSFHDSPSLPSPYSTLLCEWRICLLILIPHTKGGWIISFLSQPAWIGPLQNSHATAPFWNRTVIHYPSSTQPLIPNLWLSYRHSFWIHDFRTSSQRMDIQKLFPKTCQ